MQPNYTMASLFSVFIGVTLFILFKGNTIGLTSMAVQWLAVASLAALLLLMAIVYIVLGEHLRRRAALREIGTAKVDALPEPSEPSCDIWASLKAHLRARPAWWHRHRQPWLLLVGDKSILTRLLPKTIEHGHLITDDAVLLWQVCNDYRPPDDAWLMQLYRLRRRRPIDGLVIVVDGAHDVLASRRVPISSLDLARVARNLHWSAPIYVLDTAQYEPSHDTTSPIAGCEFMSDTDGASIQSDLLTLRDQLAQIGVQRLSANLHDGYVAELSERLDGLAGPLTSWITALTRRRFSVRGLLFAPSIARANGSANASVPRPSSVWSYLSDLTRRHRGQRVGLHPTTVCSAIALALVGVWMAGMLISAFANANEIRRSQHVIQSLKQEDDASRLRALLALQQHIGAYEERLQRYLPGVYGFGLNRDRDTLDVLWARYAAESRALLTTPVQLSLESSLVDLGKMRADALQDSDAQHRHYNRLKAYLMLSDPARTNSAFLAAQISNAWPTITAMPPAEWQDTSQRLARFFAMRLKAHTDWHIKASTPIVTAARSALVNQIGLANADDTIYRSLIDSARGKYADLSLTSLLRGTDAQGLFTTAITVPGIYTRAAWDGFLAEAVDKAASDRQMESDWVLTGISAKLSSAPAMPPHQSQGPDLKQRLSSRYFSDYASAWQHMLNSIQWQPATNLNMAVDQLTRLTDAQTSPLIALMKSVRYEAQAGRSTTNLGDTLVHHARRLIGSNEAPDMEPAITGPLEATFGPLLALFGDPVEGEQQNAAADTNNRSLQSFLRSVTSLRLTLQKISGSVDAQAMAGAFAQGVFQGKLSELTQTRNDAALTAAGLGSAWAGVAQALFVQPVESAWQALLQPAAASLNDLWRDSLAMPFNRAFAGRYPFFDTQADASLAEIGRFIRPGTGLLDRFLTTQLSGVLSAQGDQWIPNGAASSPIALDPAFLEAVQQLTDLGTHMYVQGEAGYRFDIMALPSPGITRSALSIDRHQIVYFNQREAWMPITWPGDGLAGGATLTWDTIDAGMRRPFDLTGDWAFLRALEEAEIQPLDSARYQVTWTQPSKESQRYVLRTQLGEGPLELLKLRGFRLPERIFATERAAAVSDTPAPIPTSLSHATLSP